MSLSWYVVRTKPQCEYLAARGLRRDGFQIFLPLVGSPTPRAGRQDSPLFPGYLFLRYDVDSQDWPSLRQMPGILGWVRLGGIVPAIPDEVVDLLVERVESINQGGGLWTRFKRGQRVQVLAGRMEGLAEVIEEPQSPEDRVRVLLDFMGRQVPAQVPWLNLRTINAEAEDARGRRRTRGKGRWVRGAGPKTLAAV